MFAMLNGKVVEKENGKIVLDVHGVGYEVNVPINIKSNIGNEINLYIKTVVREDDISLFGFSTKEEKKIFNMLKSVNGVGAKTALAILSFYDFNDLNQIIINKNAKLLSKVPGIGLKTAERIILDLKGKFFGVGSFEPSSSNDNLVYNDVFNALTSLGFKEDKVHLVLKKRNELVSSGKPVEEILKNVLRNFA